MTDDAWTETYRELSVADLDNMIDDLTDRIDDLGMTAKVWRQLTHTTFLDPKLSEAQEILIQRRSLLQTLRGRKVMVGR